MKKSILTIGGIMATLLTLYFFANNHIIQKDNEKFECIQMNAILTAEEIEEKCRFL
jgi:hypothetical protein